MLTFLFIVAMFILIFVFCIWITIVVLLDDYAVPSRTTLSFRNILVVFPHPDDESLSCGGLVHMLAGRGVKTTLLILTKGECGTTDATTKLSLKEQRSRELVQSAKVLSFTTVMHEDMGDGKLTIKRREVTAVVSNTMKKIQPDLVITYDPSGVYGHPDHMVVSNIITDLVAKTFPSTALWYASVPNTMFRVMSLPTHMAKDPEFAKLRLAPTHRVFIGYHVIAKVRSLMSHKSQLSGYKKAFPIPWLPAWFPYSTRLFEYFTEVKPTRRVV